MYGRPRGFSLDGATLVCDSCATTFDARTGGGTQGACVDYPKARAPFTGTEALISMSLAEPVESYERTASGEDTLFEVVVETPPDDEDEDTSWPRCCARCWLAGIPSGGCCPCVSRRVRR